MSRGAQAERLAADYLAARGLKILASNFRVRGGEVDLVCADGPTLVFVEVRLRKSQRYGGAAASIDHAKRRRIVLAARHYLAGRPEQPCRFDAVLLDALDAGRIEWLRAAFDAQ
jgi:putative endonuclease